MTRTRVVLLGLPFPIALIALWHVAVQQDWISIIPLPGDAAKETWDFLAGGIYDTAQSGTLAMHLLASGGRVLTGFAVAAAVAVPLGILIGRSRRLETVVGPTINLLRPIPVTAWVPLVLIVFGLGGQSTVILVFIAAVYPILLNTIAGVRGASKRLLEAGQMLGTSRLRMLTRIVLPASLPSVLTGMRVGLGFAWVVVVVGETTGVPEGLGAVITEAREVSNTALIIAGMATIGLAGYASDRLITLLVRTLSGRRPLTATS
jgi:NitT/TauT family transport system permease protein